MWLLEASVLRGIQQAMAAGVAPSFQAQADYVARYGADGGDSSRVLTIAGDVAEIRVNGAITQTPNFFAMLFGGGNVTWPEIVNALAAADADPEVARAELRIDSPGGTVSGMFDAMAAVQAFKKPLKAVVSNKAASAAYALASQADEIVATNRAASFGSIGIAVSIGVDENMVDIASSLAPKKRPDVTTEEGKAVVREELDALHTLFVESIAEGRDTDVDKVNADFGMGAMVLAEEALKRGMIDSVAGVTPLRLVDSSANTKTASSGEEKPERTMDLSTLKAQHPAVYQAAVQEGIDSERDRVTAHLTMGEASGDMKTAIGAINEGQGMTAKLQAQYMAAGMNRKDTENRAEDDAAAAAAASGAAQDGDKAPTAEELVVRGVEQAMGLEVGNV